VDGTKYCGWNEQGMARYTLLVQSIQNDCDMIQQKELQQYIKEVFRFKHNEKLNKTGKNNNDEMKISKEEIIEGWKGMCDLDL